MSSATANASTGSRAYQFYQLTKPRVVSLIVFTAIIGMLLAVPGMVALQPFLAGTVGIGLVAGAAAAMNCLVEQKIDAIMARTRARPLPLGQLTSAHTLIFGTIVGGIGLAILYFWVNALTMWLTLVTFVGYAVTSCAMSAGLMIFLSNGPGDPAATGEYAVPVIKKAVDSGIPTFGICLGHQIIGLALGGKTYKLKFGHHGANHPVKDLETGQVVITSQNHGFAVDAKSLPAHLRATHVSLFDATLQGLARTDRPAFCFQGHPEASPGPHDIAYLFDRFIRLMEKK